MRSYIKKNIHFGTWREYFQNNRLSKSIQKARFVQVFFQLVPSELCLFLINIEIFSIHKTRIN